MNLYRRLIPKSLFARAVTIIVLPLIFVQVIAAGVVYDWAWTGLGGRLANWMAGDVAMVVEMVERYPGAETRAWVFDAARKTTGVKYNFREGDTMGMRTPREYRDTFERLLVRALDQRVGRPFRLNAWSDRSDVRVNLQLTEGVLEIAAPRGNLYTSIIQSLLLWTLVSSAACLAIATFFLRTQVRPIRRLAQAADAFGKGIDVPDFKPAGATEVRQAASAFVMMRERIKRYVSQRTDMLAGVSHDLRTPLTRMKLELAMLGESPSAVGLKSDVHEMERMVESYLAFARGEGEETAERTDVRRLLTDIVASARRDGSLVELEADGDLSLSVRPHAFKRALDNLVINATRHAQRVFVHAQRLDHATEIIIDDDGPGIPPERREDVFKPFFRLDMSRNTATGGVGLGLTIARDVLRGHGGDVTIDDSPLGGVRARVWLPV
jgi:two-component system, OmpR family, osmolarity sensor histidine kinase EnvZ